MKKTQISLCLFFLVSLNLNGVNNNNITKDTIKDKDKDKTSSVNHQITKPIEDYKKATDSILTVTNKNNIKSEKELAEIKKYDELYLEQEAKAKSIAKEVNSNINKLLTQIQKNKRKTSIAKYKQIGDTSVVIVSIDSVLIKGNILRKQRYDYILEFSNGIKKTIKTN